MITYWLWKTFIEEFNKYTTNFEKINTYAFCSFISIFTIVLDILSSPFQLIGLLIFLIANRKKEAGR